MPRVNTKDMVVQIARTAHEANKAYCEMHGDFSQVAFDDAPENIKASAIDGVLSILEGRVTEPGQSHENWLKFKIEDGWKYGDTKDAEAKTHPSLLPFDQLSEVEQGKDKLFVSIVKSFMLDEAA